MTEGVRIEAAAGAVVSGLWDRPDAATAVLVLAHGAGAGMTHPFMEAVARGLTERRIATLRFQFPSMEAGSKRPDGSVVAIATVRAAVEAVRGLAPDLPLFAGGKSFGGRMTSQAQAEDALVGVRGLVFFGFPLHPAKKPSTARAAHLDDVHLPMLFLQGTRDALAEADLIAGVAERLGKAATLVMVEGADHSFHVSKRSGRTDVEVLVSMLDATAEWIAEVLART